MPRTVARAIRSTEGLGRIGAPRPMRLLTRIVVSQNRIAGGFLICKSNRLSPRQRENHSTRIAAPKRIV